MELLCILLIPFVSAFIVTALLMITVTITFVITMKILDMLLRI